MKRYTSFLNFNFLMKIKFYASFLNFNTSHHLKKTMNDSQTLDCLKYEPKEPAQVSLIFMHGLGASGHDFQDFPQYLQIPNLAIRFIFPHAPKQPVTICGGATVPSWFNIVSLERSSRVDAEGIQKSSQHIQKFIQQELESGIKSENIIIGGFSQGGLIALYTSLFYPVKLGGVLALSTYFPKPKQMPEKQGLETPILMTHGTQDTVIPYDIADESRQVLEGLGAKLQWREYAMAHEVCSEEIQDIQNWVQSCFTS